MNINKVTIGGIAVVVIAGLFVSPAQAHRKYRPHHKGLPRRVLVRHSHSPSESAKAAAPTQSKTKDFDLLEGTADIIAGRLKTLDNAVEVVLCSSAEPASPAQKIKSRKDLSMRPKYRFSQKHKHPRSAP